MIHWEFIPKGRAVDADIYCQQLERVHEILRHTYPAFVNRNRVLLQQDNVRPHTAQTETIMGKIQALGVIELLPHPTCSPDLVPSNFRLIRSTAHFLRGRNFDNIEAVEMGLVEFFA